MLKAIIAWFERWFGARQEDRELELTTPTEDVFPTPDVALFERPVDRFSRKNATARLINAFDSAHPVRLRQNLYGRDDKLETLFDAIVFNHQHAIIHGARGSGKTSLAQVFGDHADQQSAIVIYTACEAAATFEDLLRPYLAFIPDSAVPFAEKEAFHRERDSLAGAFGPREMVEFLSRLSPENQIIFILDEFDRVERSDVSQQIATLMKLMSDARLPVQLLIVGIAQTLDDLIDCHPSLRRHLVPIPIGRISDEDSDALIDTGAQRAGVSFEEASKAKIIAISCGSPYHVQLFCYAAANEALRKESTVIDLDMLESGLKRACSAWATLNPSDADLFAALVEHPVGDLARIEQAARQAAMQDIAHLDDDTADLLGVTLRADPARPGVYSFRDSAAPQFLLAQIALKNGLSVPDYDQFDLLEQPSVRPLPMAM